MSYERKYNFKGIEPLIENVIRIVRRDIEAELVEIARDTGETAPPKFEEYLRAEKTEPKFPLLLVQPDEDDISEIEDVDLNEEFILDITITDQPTEDLEKATKHIIRRKNAVRNILLAAEEEDIFKDMTHQTGWWEIRGGRFTWVMVNGVYVRAVRNMKLHSFYGYREGE